MSPNYKNGPEEVKFSLWLVQVFFWKKAASGEKIIMSGQSINEYNLISKYFINERMFVSLQSTIFYSYGY